MVELSGLFSYKITSLVIAVELDLMSRDTFADEGKNQMNSPAGTHGAPFVVSVWPLLAAQEQQVLAFLLFPADRKIKNKKTKPEENDDVHLSFWLSVTRV